MRDMGRIIELMSAAYPALEVRQLEVFHPGSDDDGLWFFNHPKSPFEVQIESPTGMCPFLMETNENENRLTTNTVDKTVQALSTLLGLNR